MQGRRSSRATLKSAHSRLSRPGASVGAEKRVVAPHTAVHAAHSKRNTVAAVPVGEVGSQTEASPTPVIALPLRDSPVDAAGNRAPAATPRSNDDVRVRFQTLHEFVEVARQNLKEDDWDYLIGAAETETTYARNRLALDSLGLRPRVLRDVSNVDCSSMLFGKQLRLPVLCAPVVGDSRKF